VVIAGIYTFNLAQGQPAPIARALALGALVLGNAAVAEIERSQSTSARLRGLGSNPLAAIVLGAAVLSYVIIVYVPVLAEAFQVQPPLPSMWLQPIVLIGIWSALTLAFRGTRGPRHP
jgi:hypothetical protein